MPTFRDTEKQRYAQLKADLVSPDAAGPGMYKGQPRAFCLPQEHAGENLHPLVRDDAIRYFADHHIRWHDGIGEAPSNHLCSSQVACVNTLWLLTRDPDLLARVFRPFLPEIEDVVPFYADGQLADGAAPYLAFEWIGTQNYLGERSWGTRGANATSADFAFRFRRTDGRTQLVLGEWKYTESYSKQISSPEALNATRLSTYQEAFALWEAQQPDLPPYEAFFVEPFYQLLRLTLLAQAMERAGEMDADIVSVVHVAPRANQDFSGSLTSPELRRYGSTVSEIWSALAPRDRFVPIATELLLTTIEQVAPDSVQSWSRYLLQRYGWWRDLQTG